MIIMDNHAVITATGRKADCTLLIVTVSTNAYNQRRVQMKRRYDKVFAGILVIAVLLLLFHPHAEGLTRDTGKTGTDLKQALLQDIENITKGIRIAEAKLNKAKEGDDLFGITITKVSIPNLKNQTGNLSRKIDEALKNQRTDKTLLMLSSDIKRAMNALNNLEQKATANSRSGSMDLLRQFSAEIKNLQSDINKLGPQPEPPDKGTKTDSSPGSSEVREEGTGTRSKALDVERKLRSTGGVKDTGGFDQQGVRIDGSRAPIVGGGSGSGGSGGTAGEREPKPKDNPAWTGEMVETDRTPGITHSSPAPDGPIVGPEDPEKDVKEK